LADDEERVGRWRRSTVEAVKRAHPGMTDEEAVAILERWRPDLVRIVRSAA
jgi:hypothetical protein